MARLVRMASDTSMNPPFALLSQEKYKYSHPGLKDTIYIRPERSADEGLFASALRLRCKIRISAHIVPMSFGSADLLIIANSVPYVHSLSQIELVHFVSKENEYERI
jgi:hypothetical protein